MKKAKIIIFIISLIIIVLLGFLILRSKSYNFDINELPEELPKEPINLSKSNKNHVNNLKANKTNKSKPIKEKKVPEPLGTFVTLGDSISSRDKQSYGKKNGEVNKGYQQFIKEKLNKESYINLGISGATITRGTEYLRGLSEIAMDYSFGDIDFIIVQAGTNDFALNVELGRPAELTKTEPNRFNFYGAYSGLVQDLKRNNKGVQIYLLTPTQRDCSDFSDVCINEAGYYLKDYVEVIKRVGEYYNVHVVDLYESIEITQETLKNYSDDGLHLNDKGYEAIANKFIKQYKKSRP